LSFHLFLCFSGGIRPSFGLLFIYLSIVVTISMKKLAVDPKRMIVRCRSKVFMIREGLNARFPNFFQEIL